jgi:hypothetical protein
VVAIGASQAKWRGQASRHEGGGLNGTQEVVLVSWEGAGAGSRTRGWWSVEAETEAAHRLVAQTDVWLCGGGNGLWLRGLGYTGGRSAASPVRRLACSRVRPWEVVLGPAAQPRAGEVRRRSALLGKENCGGEATMT